MEIHSPTVYGSISLAVHTINHNRNTITPKLIYFDTVSGQRLFATETVLNANQVQIVFFVPRSIRGSIE